MLDLFEGMAQTNRLVGYRRGPLDLGFDRIEDVARVSKPGFDVGPDLGFEGVGSDRLTPAPAGEGTALDQLTTAAIPADTLAALRANVCQPVEAAPDDAFEQVAPVG